MGPEEEKSKFFVMGPDDVPVFLENAVDIAASFGESYSLLSELLCERISSGSLEIAAYLTAKEISNLKKLMGVKRKANADIRKRGQWKRYRQRKAEKIRKKVEYGRLRKR